MGHIKIDVRVTSMLQIYEEAPNFMMRTPDGETDLYRWLGNEWGILFNHPRNFQYRTVVERSNSSAPRAEIKAFSIIHRASRSRSAVEPAPQNFQLTAAPANIVAAYALFEQRDTREIEPRTAFVIDPQKSIRLIKLLPTVSFCEQNELIDIVTYTVLLQTDMLKQREGHY